ncbi:MAG: LemA family protein, partial [Bacteroidetes bacterium]|nr:LemA family protein [Bacteroidota bacterium]
MRSALVVVGVVLLIIGLAFFSGIGSYNGMVTADEAVTRSWADVETQYQRRADLIPNLVNTVRGASDFEQETLTAVTEARARATSVNLSPGDLSDPAKMESFMAA